MMKWKMVPEPFEEVWKEEWEKKKGFEKIEKHVLYKGKGVRFWSCFFLFVRVTVEVTSNRWTLQMHISCRIYGAIRQHTGQIFECFRHGDHILCHLVFSNYFSFLLSFSPWYLSLSTLGKWNLHHCTLECVNAKRIGIWWGREEQKLLKIKFNCYVGLFTGHLF